ncbi:MAG: type B 50S ribosomal protein L31 [Mycoplasmatales bacterium]|nr:type B 50S ribosomal protein L31 [Mycoplasmatales bacterium]
MKKEIHPDTYREVVFKDVTSGEMFLVKSTVQTDEKIEFEGKEYPSFTIDTSSASHPFYTGDTTSSKKAGRVDRFNKRVAAAKNKQK